MKFAYRTNLIIGYVSVFIVATNLLALILPALSGTRQLDVNQVVGVCIFGILGVLMLVSAYKLKRHMKMEEERQMQSEFLSSTAN